MGGELSLEMRGRGDWRGGVIDGSGDTGAGDGVVSWVWRCRGRRGAKGGDGSGDTKAGVEGGVGAQRAWREKGMAVGWDTARWGGVGVWVGCCLPPSLALYRGCQSFSTSAWKIKLCNKELRKVNTDWSVVPERLV